MKATDRIASRADHSPQHRPFLRLARRYGAVVGVVAMLGGPAQVHAGQWPDRAAIDALPTIELPATASRSDVFAIILSGDGGWADLDKSFGEAFQQRGLATVGFDCLKYFWKTRQPAEVSRALETMIRYYLQAWNKKRVLLVGFSFGACWLPFLVNRLPADLLQQVQLSVLLGPSDFVNVEIHVMDWMSDERRASALEVLPEARKISTPLLCVYGTEEDDAICPSLKGNKVTVLAMPGDHHYNYHYDPVIEAIFTTMAALEQPAGR
jgi:type IV secretory pathway VirJ component